MRTKMKNMDEESVEEFEEEFEKRYNETALMLVDKVKNAPNGEEQAKAAETLGKFMKIDSDREAREQERELREKEIKNSRINAVISGAFGFVGMVVSNIFYHFIVKEIEHFESTGEMYTSEASKKALKESKYKFGIKF